MAKKLLYPHAEELKNGKRFDFIIDTEPDTLNTSSGICPNYEKFEKMGITAEQALIFCNMD